MSSPIVVGSLVPITLQVQLTLGTVQLVEWEWPHFNFKIYLSVDDTWDDEDYEVQYTMSKCQWNNLRKAFTADSSINIDLNDAGVLNCIFIFSVKTQICLKQNPTPPAEK